MSIMEKMLYSHKEQNLLNCVIMIEFIAFSVKLLSDASFSFIIDIFIDAKTANIPSKDNYKNDRM